MSSGDFGRIDRLLSSLDDIEDFAGNVTFDAPDSFELGMSLADSLFDVGLGTGVGSQTAERNDMQRAVAARSSPRSKRTSLYTTRQSPSSRSA